MTDKPKPAFGRDALDAIAVIALTDIVLLPHCVIPLTLTDPREIALVDAAFDTGNPIALAQRCAAGFPGAPDLEPVVGIGVIEHYQRIDPTERIVTVRGVMRADVLRELDVSTEYRQIYAAPIEETGCLERATELADTLRACLLCLAQANATFHGLYATFANTALDPGGLADATAGVVITSTRERQALLSDPNRIRRLERVQHRVSQLLVHAGDTARRN